MSVVSVTNIRYDHVISYHIRKDLSNSHHHHPHHQRTDVAISGDLCFSVEGAEAGSYNWLQLTLLASARLLL